MTQQERDKERRRQAAVLEQVTGMASAMPHSNALPATRLPAVPDALEAMTSPLLLLERVVELSRALTSAGVPHALGGALALAFHVEDPRATSDIDMNITADAEHPRHVFAALPDGVRWDDDDVARVVRDGQVRLFWGEEGSRYPLDLFFPQHELHDLVASRAETVTILDAPVAVLSATDLCIFKCLFDRRRDWADIVALLAYGEVDVDEVRAWLTHIVGPGDDRFGKLDEAAQEASQPEPIAKDLFRRR